MASELVVEPLCLILIVGAGIISMEGEPAAIATNSLPCGIQSYCYYYYIYIYRRHQFHPLLPLWLFDRIALLIHESFRSHHLDGIMERIQRWLGCPVRAEIVVGPGEILSIVDGKVHMVQRVVRRAVDELLRPMASNHVTVVDQDGPDLNSHEEGHVQISLHWANKDKDTFEC